ncbi:hypothetical protein HYQ46_001959 [Verticillium longisporum]|nr:hypothetical protein HYQ46_001959 [Verticillium longisporum]
MTAGVGFDKYWDEGGAVTPEEAAASLAQWTDGLDISKTGEYWAPRGPRDIGTAEAALGKGLPTPLQLPCPGCKIYEQSVLSNKGQKVTNLMIELRVFSVPFLSAWLANVPSTHRLGVS